ncbi:Outer membrane efflux protein [Sulfurimonas denitrificans DSM 1251]|uniref:Outer membrane efflux protein n=1 Tax=Sulfurimonas denitrificans (strain ATCC 33889 / DSM 1251) TaxID=326298 RepID=Q30NW7_SULDN|nr:TolC family protein [Sulfurimonas denitrificans]ABB45314.1 Outer membrane efflux protein [Sulfurimonas denitrificans DSM 1251]MDD3442113.1 TolC family protein [Sulfurimonas denitrificans]
MKFKKGYIAIMKRVGNFYLILILLSNTALYSKSVELLSKEKQELLLQEQKRYESEHEKLKYNWIAPLNLNASYGYDKSASDMYSDSKKIQASISQDIFRSGGITYAINYADAKKRADELGLYKEISSLNEDFFLSLLGYKKSNYELEQSTKKLANYDIEIFIKRQLYTAGKVDITELNNALMNKSAEQKNYALLEANRAKYRLEVSKISDIDPQSYQLYSFELIQEDNYLRDNFDLQFTNAQSKSYKELYNITKSSYLPSLTISGSTGYQSYDARESFMRYDGGFYSAGLSLNIPISYNANATKEEAKAIFLKSSAELQDKERSLRASYAQSIELIKSYKRYIEITSKNLSLYDELIAVIASGVDMGYKTGYDLQTLKNSKEIEQYNIKINEINIELELAKLHFSTNKEHR